MRLHEDAHPAIAEVLDLALDSFRVKHYIDNGWYGADLIGDGGHTVRLTAESNDPDETVRVIVFGGEAARSLVNWQATFDGRTPRAALVAFLAEAVK